jgi:hypothetical protein
MTAQLKLIPRNAALLIALLALLAVVPSITVEASWLLVELTFDSILLAGVYSTESARRHKAFLVLTVVTLAIRWGRLLFHVEGLQIAALAVTVVWLVHALSIIIADLFQRRDVTIDTILGAVVVYLLAAVAFAILFQLVETLHPGSFSGIPDVSVGDEHELGDAMLYFSMVCITTMGYGDIVPVSDLARPISVLEGAFGQLYLAVMIARLVGLHLARDRN